MTTPQQVLSDEQMWILWNAQGSDEMNKDEAIAFARQAISATLAALGGQEPVAVIGPTFQLLWARVDWSAGLKVGDKLYTLPPAQPAPAMHTDGWRQDGGMLYRLTDERRPQNRDEINVTMADGSRSEASRTRRAGELLDRIRGAQPAPVDERHRAVTVELDRLMLVIESAVRWQDPTHHAAVLSLLKANRAALQAPAPQATKGGEA